MTVNWIARGDAASGYLFSNQVTDDANTSDNPNAYLQLGPATGPGRNYHHLYLVVQYNITHILNKVDTLESLV